MRCADIRARNVYIFIIYGLRDNWSVWCPYPRPRPDFLIETKPPQEMEVRVLAVARLETTELCKLCELYGFLRDGAVTSRPQRLHCTEIYYPFINHVEYYIQTTSVKNILGSRFFKFRTDCLRASFFVFFFLQLCSLYEFLCPHTLREGGVRVLEQ